VSLNLYQIIKKIVFILAVIIGLFHLFNLSGILVLSTQIIRIIHLMIILSIVFLNISSDIQKEENWMHSIFRIVASITSVASGIYMLTRWKEIAMSGGVTNVTDSIVGIIMLIIILEATRRSVGNILAVIVVIFLTYPFIGSYLPGIFHARTYSLQRVASFLFASGQGIYGIPIGVSATYIVIFCLYGAFLKEFGAGDFLHNLSTSLTKGLIAATAKTTVIFSALVGIISGSAAGNVAVSGTFTIPMMKKDGYKSHEAGAIAAVAATGGQIMPPVMGAAAFIMAEITGRPYLDIMKAGIIPALLFFSSIFIVVHLEALKQGNIGKGKIKDRKVLPFSVVLREGWHYLLPIAALIYMLINGNSPVKSAFYSIMILLLVSFINFILKRNFSLINFIKMIINSLEKGILSAVPIAIACASAGIIAGILSMTGLGSKFSSLIIHMSYGIPLIALILTMIASIILGMGLPTTAAYLVLATVVAPALVKLGVPLLTAHMFVFFFGCISTITPPVALASYVAAGIANANINKLSWTAFRFGLTSFVLPYMFFWGPALLLQGSWWEILYTVITALVGVFSIASGIVGFLRIKLSMVIRAILFIAGCLMMYQGILTDIIGMTILTFIYIINNRIIKKELIIEQL